MKNIKAILILGTLFLLWSNTFGAVALWDDFGSHSLGDIDGLEPDIGQIWEDFYNGGRCQVVDIVSYVGTKSVELARTATDPVLLTGKGLRGRDYTAEPRHKLKLTVSWFAPSAEDRPVIGLFFGTGDRNIARITVDRNNIYEVYDAIADEYISTGVKASIETWETIQLVLHVKYSKDGMFGGTYDVYRSVDNGTTEIVAQGIPYKEIEHRLMFVNALFSVGIPDDPDYTSKVYFDNIAIEKYLIAECGDVNHPYPDGDINKDCAVNFLDFMILAENWLTCLPVVCE